MRIKIHRGAHEIGGSCIELEADGARLVLDLGRPLAAGADAVVARPAVPGLERPDPSLVGLVITHPHLDHYGLAPGVASSVPVFMGEAAFRLLVEASFFTNAPVPPAPAGHLRHRVPFTVGPFTVTPFLADHSAFDAYSLLIEAGGRRLFYTGDFRGHGRKRALFEELLRMPPAGVDVLLMEGTNVRAGDRAEAAHAHADADADAHAHGAREVDVELAIAAVARRTSGMVLAMYAPQNIDRLVTMFRAARRARRELVLDLYAATVAAATGRASIPQAWWEGVRVYLPQAQRRRIVERGAFGRTDAVRSKRIYAEELRARASELVMTCRGSMAAELHRAGCLDGAHAVWSMWPGYLKEPASQKLLGVLRERGVPISIHHASGHAFVGDLQRLVEALAPRCVVPIHSSAGDRFGELFPRVARRRDGESFVV